MSKVQLPDALMTKPMATVSTMKIETSILDPIVCTQTFARFVLEKKGILDMGSFITLSLHPASAADGLCHLPVKTGAHCAIKRAVLRIGSKIVATSDDYAHYQTIRRQFKTAEEKSLRDMIKVGAIDVVCPDNAQTGKLQLRDVIYDDTTGAAATVLPSILLLSSTEQSPVFQIKLSELFPMMRLVQLPLYLINDPCTIELTFNTQGATQEGILAIFDPTYTGSKAVTIGTGNVKFMADYLTYNDDRMDELAKLVMSSDGMLVPYEDLVLTATTIPAALAGEQRIVRDIGLSGMTVKNILVSQGLEIENGLVGKYGSKAFHHPDSYNLRINDLQRYPRDIKSEAIKAHELSKVFGVDLGVNTAEYSYDVSVEKDAYTLSNEAFSSNTLMGHPMTELTGQQHFIGVDLTTDPFSGRGTQIGQKPIQFYHTLNRTALSLEAREVRYFSTVERVMQLKNGQVMVSA